MKSETAKIKGQEEEKKFTNNSLPILILKTNDREKKKNFSPNKS